MSDMADFAEEGAGDARVLRFSGDLSLAKLGALPKRLHDYAGAVSAVDLSGVERIDTVGAWVVHRFAVEHQARVDGLAGDKQHLFAQVENADQPVAMRAVRPQAFIRVLGEVGDAATTAARTMLGLLGFMGATAIAAGGVIRSIWHPPRRFRFNAVVQEFEAVGVTALAIIGLMSFLIGVVIAQQGAVQLQQFGAEVYTINLVGRLTLRELGVLMTAIMVAGRSGSAFAAQIGTMKLTEEVDAMRVIGVSPMEALVLPRTLAAILTMPLLGFYASLWSIVGGGLLCWISLNIPPVTFIERIREVVPITDLYVGLIKAPVFGAIIAIAGCYQGMQVEADAEQVGRRTTAAVVQGIFMVIVIDAFFAVFFEKIGWL